MSDETILRRVACWQEGGIDFAGGYFQSVEFDDGVPELLLAFDLGLSRIDLHRVLGRLERRGRLRRLSGSPWWFGPFAHHVRLAWHRLDGKRVELELRKDARKQDVSYVVKVADGPAARGAYLADRPQAHWALTPEAFAELDADLKRIALSDKLRAEQQANSVRPKKSREQWLAEAMLLVQRHPDWPDSKIAKEVGVNRSTLSRSELYQNAAREARRGSAPPRGGPTGTDDEGRVTYEPYFEPGSDPD